MHARGEEDGRGPRGSGDLLQRLGPHSRRRDAAVASQVQTEADECVSEAPPERAGMYRPRRMAESRDPIGRQLSADLGSLWLEHRVLLSIEYL